ncbi:phage tail tape measure protein [Streptomyces fulvorobeus]|uniref:Phage-related minor tail protein n=1 Tax=Streptomyces fulvorobeus TaxID=284028 RepID=A0A7J0C5K9_9ACTN|nr:phage tail tape measure protein [Streptomyces fulvorobeus]NYE40683.1 phage-related minor tail protein [Streptomyces fulvorobeus]GFM96986.1 hypothetical protein Sfulv_17970 [Streptomyces fulvorobeus]
MTTLSELLVDIGVDTDDLTGGTAGAADEVERSLAGIGDAADQAARDVADAADAAATAMDDVGASADQAAQDAEQAAAGVEGSFRGIAAAAAGGLVGALFIAGLTNAMDAKAANDKLASQLGLTEAEAERAGDAAGDLFSQGFGESIDEVNTAIKGVASNMGGLGKVTDTELREMSASVLAVAKTFDQDLGQTSRAVGQLMKTGMAKDATEALDIVAAGLRKGADGGGDFLDTLIGGADNLKSFGFTGQQATGLIVQGLNAGAESAESVTGLFEELVGNVSAGGDDLADTFKELGLNGQQMATDLTSGGPAANEALDKLLDSIRALEDPIKQDAMVAALFGEEGAAMQNTLMAIDPSSATAALGEFGGVAKEVTDNAEDAQSMDAIWRSIATTLGEILAPALKVVADFIAEHPGLIQVLVPVLLGLAIAIGVAAVAQWAWNTALWAWPGTWIIAGIIALIAVIVLIIVYWDEIAAATSAAWDWVADKTGQALDWVSGEIESAMSWIGDTWDEGWAWLERKTLEGVLAVIGFFGYLGKLPGRVAGWLGDIVGYVAGLPGRIADAASGMWDSLKYGFINTLNYLIWKWNNFQLTLGGGSVLGMDIPSVTLSTPDIPYLADGGITTGPTVAMIGEGPEDEAVLPLSRLDGMLRSVAGPVSRVEQAPLQVIVTARMSEGAFAEAFQYEVRTKAGGSVARYAGEDE